MNYHLYVQLPKPKDLGIGSLSVDNTGSAIFFFTSGSMASLNRCHLEAVAMKGIRISGFELIGVDKQGQNKYRYQEWWLAYLNPNSIEQ